MVVQYFPSNMKVFSANLMRIVRADRSVRFSDTHLLVLVSFCSDMLAPNTPSLGWRRPAPGTRPGRVLQEYCTSPSQGSLATSVHRRKGFRVTLRNQSYICENSWTTLSQAGITHWKTCTPDGPPTSKRELSVLNQSYKTLYEVRPKLQSQQE